MKGRPYACILLSFFFFGWRQSVIVIILLYFLLGEEYQSIRFLFQHDCSVFFFHFSKSQKLAWLVRLCVHCIPFIFGLLTNTSDVLFTAIRSDTPENWARGWILEFSFWCSMNFCTVLALYSACLLDLFIFQ